MCCRLDNSHHCLTFLSIIGLLQTVVAIPITVLSFLVYFQSSLGIIIAPFWCGLLLLVTGIIAILIRPSRLAIVICFHVMLNAVSIITCLVAGAITGAYGTAVHLSEYDNLLSTSSGGGQMTACIFSDTSSLYTANVRNFFSPIEELIPDCNDLNEYWTYLVAIMSLSFIGLIVSIVGIFSNCITPCVEDYYQHSWKPGSTDV